MKYLKVRSLAILVILSFGVGADMRDDFKKGYTARSDKNYKVAKEWFTKSAKQGFSFAQYNLGLMYFHGYGVSKDYKIANEWFIKSASQKNSFAELNLGFMYDHGFGVTENDRVAFKWYRKSASRKNAGGQFNLGLMYFFGEGVAEDENKARFWIKKAHKNVDLNVRRQASSFLDRHYTASKK